MKVTRVNLNYPKSPDSKVLAYANVILDGELSIHSIKLTCNDERMFIAFPERFVESNNYKEDGERERRGLAYVHPTNNVLRTEIYKAIVNTFIASNPGYSRYLETMDQPMKKDFVKNENFDVDTAPNQADSDYDEDDRSED